MIFHEDKYTYSCMCMYLYDILHRFCLFFSTDAGLMLSSSKTTEEGCGRDNRGRQENVMAHMLDAWTTMSSSSEISKEGIHFMSVKGFSLSCQLNLYCTGTMQWTYWYIRAETRCIVRKNADNFDTPHLHLTRGQHRCKIA